MPQTPERLGYLFNTQRTDDVNGYASITTESVRSGRDFSRIPIHSKSPVQIQAKLAVNTPGDVYEQEADRAADAVMRMPKPQFQRNCDYGGECLDRQVHEHVRAERGQPSGTGESPVLPIVHEVIRSPGQPLDPATCAFMEPRFGHNFSQVRIHTDAKAAESTRAVNGLAYTVGRDVVFGAGQYVPGTSTGQRLLAHELTHVVQQRGSQLLQRQQNDETSRPAETPSSQPAAATPGGVESTSQSTPISGPVPSPRSNWTPDVPYIWFDLHDAYRALTEPAGPYLYSSYVRKNRIDNPNFSNNINPGPVRNTTTVLPGGFRAQPNDLLWFFYTKFFVDSAAANLPPAYTRFETSADIRFAPMAGGQGFEENFVDNNPRYVSPGGLSFAFPY